jgi:hypothetical protein
MVVLARRRRYCRPSDLEPMSLGHLTRASSFLVPLATVCSLAMAESIHLSRLLGLGYRRVSGRTSR